MVKSANEIWGDWNTTGVPASGVKKPLKSDIREWGSAIEIFTSSSGSALVYQTRTALYADLVHDANQMAWVVADSTVAYNGIYQKSGASGSGSWSKVAELPIEVLLANNSGAGTANAIQVTTQYPLGSGRLIIVPILLANTSTTVTLSVNGATALPIKTATGANPLIGGLVPSTIVMYYNGSQFGLLSDLSSAAVTTALATHEARTDNPHSVTKAQVGLGNADNTSDINKPISTATQTALDAKVTSGGSIGSGATVPTPGPTDDSTKVANTEWVRDYLTAVSSGVVTFNGRAGTVVSQAGDYTPTQVGALAVASNLSDLASASTARTNLGLGSAATLTAGTLANNVVQLTSAAKLPAVDGSLLTGLVFTKFFISSEISIVSGTQTSISHGLGAVPKIIQAFLICKTAEAGYSIGEYVAVNPTYYYIAANAGMGLGMSDTTLFVSFSTFATPFAIVRKDSGVSVVVTNANWRLILHAYA